MKLGYDNLEDAKGKLVGTFCLYKGKAFSVKALWTKEGTDPEDNVFVLNGISMNSRTNISEFSIDDPHFNCSEYNIGYMNNHGYAQWFYRIPYKQYKQGLRHDQVNSRCSNSAYHSMEFKHCTALGKMLENDYPSYLETAKLLMSGDFALIAFHKNFAMSRDNIHNDYILEYKGQHIGFTPNLKEFKLLHEHEHIYEALVEATK